MNAEDRFDTWSRALGLLAIFLIAAAGFCWLDTVDNDHGKAGVDLCFGMIAPAFGVVMVFYMTETGRPAHLRRWSATPVTIAVLDPPPWSHLSA
jgi:DMSO reductase anchor subunit